jgi:hypothetical protein
VAVLVADRSGGAGRRGRGAVVADLVVAELVLAVVALVVREAAVPSSPRWWLPRWRCWSPIALVAALVAFIGAMPLRMTISRHRSRNFPAQMVEV